MNARSWAGSTPPAEWPRAARWGVLALVAALPLALPACLGLNDDARVWHQLQAQAQQARDDYRGGLARKQAMDLAREHRDALGRALWSWRPGDAAPPPEPGWTESLLRDIHQTAQGPAVRLELFRPGPPVTRPHHVELPFTLRVVGTYRELAAFAAALAVLNQAVVVDRLTLAARSGAGPSGDTTAEARGLLTLDLAARAVRMPPSPESAAPAARTSTSLEPRG
ncbi:type 4a pilus biogenesis protein PilO [Hylemonella sp. W303a]|uniref:type 4a pilus biogenesis protein PilO n=1 Tax=Hylemonella sp. W303a TaxID=3389873 RepID=UPI00396B3A60